MDYSYVVGGLVKVTSEKPDDSDYPQGAVLTIASLHIENTGNGVGVPYAVLTPGGMAVRLENLEPVAKHDNIHPDTDYDATVEELEAFEEIVDLDPLLRVWQGKTMAEVATMEGIEYTEPVKPEEVARPDGGVATAEREHADAAPRDVPSIEWTDLDGNTMEVLYLERNCPTHGIEAIFRFVTDNAVAVDLPLPSVVPFFEFLQKWAQVYMKKVKDEKNGQS